MNWLDIKGYEGLYQVSDTGLVKSLDRLVIQISRHGTPMNRLYIGRVLSPRVGKAGYKYLHLSKDGIKKTHKVHRLVALHFCNSWFEDAIVNHIDGDKLNNHFSNLEWVTITENNRHAVDLGLAACLRTGKESNSSKYIYSAFDENGILVKEFIGLSETLEFGFSQSSVWACCIGKQETHRGYKFTRRLKNECY